jgi:phosphatidylglycerol:prolipoprotein diacylglycerol transferase
MRLALFRRSGVTIPSYTAMLYLGLVAGVVAGDIAARKAGLNTLRVYVATCLLTVPALAGARLLHVACHWRFYRQNRQLIWKRGEAGLALHGGLLLALVLSPPLLRALQLPLGAYWDTAVFTMLTGMIFTKIGCLLNGCCAGRPSCSWIALRLSNQVEVRERIPSQLLELGWAALLLAFAASVWPRRPFPGSLFLCATIGFETGRLLLRSLRERMPGAGRLGIEHLISTLMLLFAAGALAASWPKG